MIALYSRVSTAEQAKEGYSIGEQQDRLTAYCKSRGWSDYMLYTDGGYSGGNTDRPALQRMIKDISRGKVSKVVVYKLDRLSRSQKDTLELLEDVFLPHNVDFISMCENFDTSSPFGKAMIGMFSVFAQLEREQIRERVTIGREARAKEGKWHGGGSAPVGYDYIDGQLIVNDFEAAQIREVYDLFLQGYTYTEIVSILNDRGWNHKYGCWKIQRVRQVLRNPVYVGKVVFSGRESDGEHESIVDPEVFRRVSQSLAAPQKGYKRRPIHEAYLVGKLFCAHCGARYTHTSSYSGHKRDVKIHYYCCLNRLHPKQLNHDKCLNTTYRCDAFDEVVFDELRKLTIEDVADYRKSAKKDLNSAIQKELAKLEKQRSRLIDLYSLGDFDAAELTAKIEPLTASIRALEQQLDARTLDDVERVIRSISDILDGDEPAPKRKLIDLLIDKIEIDGDDITIHWNFD